MTEIDDDAFDRHYLEMTYEVGRFMMDHLRRVYREFDGDMAMCMVLGEVGHHTVSHFMRDILPRSGTDSRTLASDAVIEATIRRCNTLSIAHASGIPRETVRRKLDKLEKLGWVSRDDKGEYRATRRVGREFRELDRETMDNLLRLSDRLRETIRRP